MRFYKYHGLGNDYIVLDPSETSLDFTKKQIQLICHRNFGIGSDGILLGPIDTSQADFGLRIFNPDGSEAEKSGNGLRIFSRYLHDKKKIGTKPFTIHTAGGIVESRVHENNEIITVQMGRVSFYSKDIPVSGPSREVINEIIEIHGNKLTFSAATVGNPHCVIIRDKAREKEAREWGPVVEVDSRFPNKTNVQFMEILDRANISIQIWERGAGYTLASGSSSSAAGAVAYRLGLCDQKITVHMPGGLIELDISDDFSITMTGPVLKIAEGTLAPEMFDQCLSE